jgi:hypothetical protein
LNFLHSKTKKKKNDKRRQTKNILISFLYFSIRQFQENVIGVFWESVRSQRIDVCFDQGKKKKGEKREKKKIEGNLKEKTILEEAVNG